MASDDASECRLADSLEYCQSLYDRHRYLDLYAFTSKFWNKNTEIESLPLEVLLLGGRLAGWLGGHRLSRWLLRKCFERDPSDPQVRYFTRNLNPLRTRFLDELKSFVVRPDIGGDDVQVRASWYAVHGFTWAALRDFDRSYECIRNAHSLVPGDSWVLSCESDIYGLADRWNDALQAAELALAADPGAPYAVHSLGMALINLGRVEESAARLFDEAKACQAYRLVIDACWHQCALAETLDGELRVTALDRARKLADRLPALMPLADREALKALARTNLDIAELSDDYSGIERWTAEVRSRFHRNMLANLARNAEGRRIRLPFLRAVQKHQACVPTSIAATMSANGITISADEMASELTFGGTREWAAADWLRGRGYYVRFFPVTPRVATELIRNRIAFVLCWDSEESGHAVAVVGLDERAETLLVHDPQSFRGTEYLLQILNPLASPLGILGMAVVRPELSAQLDHLLPPESAVMEAAQEYDKRIMLHGPSASRQVVSELMHQFPSHPGSAYLDAVQNLEDGQVGQSLSKLKQLLLQFPESPIVRVRFFYACRALGNSALLLQALRDIVEAGVLPGMKAQQDWIYPPDRYVYEYADLLRLSTSTRHRAESLLIKLIERQGNSAGAWHNLADLLWHKRDMEGALLSYRISSCLAEHDEHYARAYADALAAQGKEEEGIQWLESRVRRYRHTPHAIGTWVSWVSMLEARGYPERALSAIDEALMQHGASAELLVFAVPFFARMGDWARADAELNRLRDAGLPHAFFEASARFSWMRGELDSAARSAEAWIAELPRSIDARYMMLDIIDSKNGDTAAVRAALQWVRENRSHEDFEAAYCAYLSRALEPAWKKYSILLRRLKRNPEDAWAWRELTFDCLQEFGMACDAKRKRLEPRILRYLAECDRTSAGSVQTVRAHALWARYRGDWAAAVAGSLESIALDPDSSYSYRHAWQCSSRLKAGEREELWGRIEPLFLSSGGRLSISQEVGGLLTERFGIAAAEKNIERWRSERPDDPDILNAAADLLIDHGHGRSDADRAIRMLEPAVQRYPYHSGLRFSLARAYRGAGRDLDAETVLAEIARRHPSHSAAKIQLAWVTFRKGDAEGAFKILEAAMIAEPRNPEPMDSRVQILIDGGRYDEAIRDIEDGLRRLPRDVHWRERSIDLFVQCGAEDRAIRAAREGIEVYPRGAYLWLLLGQTLNQMRHHAEIGEIESCLRKSLELNCTLFEPADLLAVLLTEQRRYDDASKIMRDIEERMADPSPAQGRLAWIRRQRGDKTRAVTALGNVLADCPWYGWGWNLLMDWLEEDADWDETRRLLQDIPPPMFTNMPFRRRRLTLLEKAKMEVAQLDREWESLLRDFPEDISLHCRRYDILAQSARWQDAADAINAIEKFDLENPFILARRCEILAHEQKRDEALEVALRICFHPVLDYTWPSDKVWDTAQNAGFAGKLDQRFRQRLISGERPNLGSFSRMASYAMRNTIKRRAQSIASIWFPSGGARELKRLVREISKLPWDGSKYRAVVYGQLLGYGYQRLVTKLSSRVDPAAVRTIDEWAEIGRAFISSHSYAKGRRFLRTWRARTGVAMWMVANYMLSLSYFQRDQLEERYRSSQDALAGLPHDHCARYLAHLQAEACALSGNQSNFLDTWHTYARYFDGKLVDGEFFGPKDRHLCTSIPKLAKYILNNQKWRTQGLIWLLWLRRFGRKL